jgi:hypothetical protein
MVGAAGGNLVKKEVIGSWEGGRRRRFMGLGHNSIRNQISFVWGSFGIQSLGIGLLYQAACVLLALLLIGCNIHWRIITNLIWRVLLSAGIVISIGSNHTCLKVTETFQQRR